MGHQEQPPTETVDLLLSPTQLLEEECVSAVVSRMPSSFCTSDDPPDASGHSDKLQPKAKSGITGGAAFLTYLWVTVTGGPLFGLT